MKFTQYFLYTRQRPDRSFIKLEWIEQGIKNPCKTEIQQDGRIKKWIRIENKFLRIILLEDGETVHNVFFDRNFKQD